jgi:hypothetical protein
MSFAPPPSAGGHFLQARATATESADGPPACVVVVEGANDAEFLLRIGQILHRHDSTIPDLHQMESDKRVVF